MIQRIRQNGRQFIRIERFSPLLFQPAERLPVVVKRFAEFLSGRLLVFEAGGLLQCVQIFKEVVAQLCELFVVFGRIDDGEILF